MGEWMGPGEPPHPTIRGPVREYIEQLGAPFTLGEIWRPLQLPRTAVNRELSRMLKKGLLTRYQIMTVNRGMNPHPQPTWLYSLAEGYE